MLELIVVLVRALALGCRGHHDLLLENLALRQQVHALRRAVKRLRVRRRVRLFWMVLAKTWRRTATCAPRGGRERDARPFTREHSLPRGQARRPALRRAANRVGRSREALAGSPRRNPTSGRRCDRARILLQLFDHIDDDVDGGAQILLSGPGASGSRLTANGQQQESGGWNRVVLKVSDLPGFVTELGKAGLAFCNEMEMGPGVDKFNSRIPTEIRSSSLNRLAVLLDYEHARMRQELVREMGRRCRVAAACRSPASCDRFN
jgi:hypothetical protein